MAVLAINTVAFGTYVVRRTITQQGVISLIRDLGLFEDSDCTQPLTNIDWGTLAPGASKTLLKYVKNNGTAVVHCAWSTSDKPSYVTFTMEFRLSDLTGFDPWPQGSTVELAVNTRYEIHFKLTVQASPLPPEESFGFDVFFDGFDGS